MVKRNVEDGVVGDLELRSTFDVGYIIVKDLPISQEPVS